VRERPFQSEPGGRVRAFGAWALALAILAWTPGAMAGLKIESKIEVKTPTSRDSLSAITYLSGPWMRREVWGTGVLSQMFGKNVQVINRATGAGFTLYPDRQRFARDTSGPQVCRPEAVVDLRFLGSVQPNTKVKVSLPDTSIELEGVRARAVQLEVQPNSPARPTTRILVWNATDLESLFGSAWADDLLCGHTDSALNLPGSLVAEWRNQFRLDDHGPARLAKGMVGYAIKIESLYGPDSALLSSTTIRTTQVTVGELSDSLFAPTPGFREGADDPGGSGE